MELVHQDASDWKMATGKRNPNSNQCLLKQYNAYLSGCPELPMASEGAKRGPATAASQPSRELAGMSMSQSSRA